MCEPPASLWHITGRSVGAMTDTQAPIHGFAWDEGSMTVKHTTLFSLGSLHLMASDELGVLDRFEVESFSWTDLKIVPLGLAWPWRQLFHLQLHTHSLKLMLSVEEVDDNSQKDKMSNPVTFMKLVRHASKPFAFCIIWV